MPQHGDAVRDLEYLAQLVGDEHDRLALRDQAANDREEFLDLSRREHGRRLVEDQDVGFAEQGLQQLDPLLLADGQVLDLGVGVDAQPVTLAQLHDPLSGGLEIEHRSAAQFVAQHDVLGDREHRDELEVLVHHPDPAAMASAELVNSTSSPSTRIEPASGW